MRITLTVILVAAIGSVVPGIVAADTDFRCLNDCTRGGYMYGYCENRCSFNSPQPSSGSFGTFDLGSTYGRGQRERLDAEERQLQMDLEKQRAENDRFIRGLIEQSQRNKAGNAEVEQAKTVFERLDQAIKYRKLQWDDFEDVTASVRMIMTVDMAGLIAESRYAADILYLLGMNPDDAISISQAPLPAAAKYIQTIERAIVDWQRKGVEQPIQ